MSGLMTRQAPACRLLLACDGRELVAKALAGSGGHDEQNVPAIGGGAADGFLIGAEGGETEGLGEAVRRGPLLLLVSHELRLVMPRVRHWQYHPVQGCVVGGDPLNEILKLPFPR